MEYRKQVAASWREELNMQNVALRHARDDVFYLPQWHVPMVVFLAYRIVVASYFLGWLVGSILYLEVQTGVDLYPWPAYISNLSYLVLACHLLAAALLVLKHLPRVGLWHVASFQERSASDLELMWLGREEVLVPLIGKDAGRLPWLVTLDWLLFNISCSVGTVTTIAYWTLFRPWQEAWLPLNLQHHVVSLAVLILETLFTAIPLCIPHVVYPMTFGIAYVTFTLILWAVDHDNVVYPNAFDWRRPWRATVLASFAVFVLVPAVHVVFWALFKLRSFVYGRKRVDSRDDTVLQ